MTIDLVITNADALDAHSFRALKSLLPHERQERSDNYDRRVDRYTSVVVFAQLQKLWAERNHRPLPVITVGRFGKPGFSEDSGLHFSWSHDSALCACVLAPMPVGVDISGPVPFEQGLFHHMAAPGERRLRGYLQRKNDLSALWTRKEATVKRTGLGLTTPLRQVDTTTAEDILTFTCEAMDFQVSLSAQGLTADALRDRLRVRFLTPRSPATWLEGPWHPLRQLTPTLM